MRALLWDIHHALRSLRKAPWFATVAIGILGLGIAASVVIFSVLDAVLLHALPYAEPERLVILHWQNQRGSRGDISSQAFFLLKNRAKSLEHASAMYPLDSGVNLTSGGSPQYTRVLRVSRDFFQSLSATPYLGRTFLPQEDSPGGARAAILGFQFWMQYFNGDPSAIGRIVRISGENYTIVGIMPQGFRSYPDAQAWIPLQLDEGSNDFGNDYRTIAKLREGATWQSAREELVALSDQYRLTYGSAAATAPGTLVLEPFQDFLVRNVRQNLVMLFFAVAFLLLIACTNLALLLLVKTSARNHEMALRAALGANRARLMQTVLCEGLILAVLGGVVGVIAAKESLPFISSWVPFALPAATTIGINQRVLLFSLGTALIAAVAVGLGPALKISRVDLNDVLKQAGRGANTTREGTRIEHMLIRTQTALTLILLTGATSLFQSFVALRMVPPGFDSEKVFVAQVSLADQHYTTTKATSQFLGRIFEKLKASSQVESVGVVNGLPLEEGLNLPFYPTDAPGKIEHAAEYRPVSADYLNVLRVRLLAGRGFSQSDRNGAAPVAIVNETLARQWWPQGPAVGRFIAMGQELGNPFSEAPRLVIGVAANVREAGLGRDVPPTIFVPIEQVPDKTTAFVNELFLTSILVRAKDSRGMAERVRAAVESADPGLPLASYRPMSEVVTGSIAWPRFYVSLTTGFGAVALLLTNVGLYGLLRYRVVRRNREIAVRLALGSSRRNVVLLLVREAVTLVSAGVILGMIGGYVLRRVLAAKLPDLSRSAPNSVFIAAVLMLGIAAFISLLTAFRAPAIEPMAVLRNE